MSAWSPMRDGVVEKIFYKNALRALKLEDKVKAAETAVAKRAQK
mgnify:CR=1 FL=1